MSCTINFLCRFSLFYDGIQYDLRAFLSLILHSEVIYQNCSAYKISAFYFTVWLWQFFPCSKFLTVICICCLPDINVFLACSHCLNFTRHPFRSTWTLFFISFKFCSFPRKSREIYELSSWKSVSDMTHEAFIYLLILWKLYWLSDDWMKLYILIYLTFSI